jgi:multisubunit Na+/H+ antiporter MnhB subunit
VLITAAALVLLLVTFRCCRLPQWITRLIGLVAALGVVGCSGMSVVMNLLTPQQAADMFTTQPAVVAVGVMSAAASALVTRSAVRSLRFARASRRSDQRADPQVG